jgi:hypothetical protein
VSAVYFPESFSIHEAIGLISAPFARNGTGDQKICTYVLSLVRFRSGSPKTLPFPANTPAGKAILSHPLFQDETRGSNRNTADNKFAILSHWFPRYLNSILRLLPQMVHLAERKAFRT